MIRIVKYLYGLLLSLLFTVSMAQSDKENFDHLSVEEGLSSSVVTSIIKDSEGFMWFGTQQGLNKYDAYEFETYLSNDSLPRSLSGNFILCLYEDRQGTLWVGTEGNGLNRYDRLKNNFIAYKSNKDDLEAISGNTVNDLLETSSGDLLIGTNHGINIYNRSSDKFSKLLLKSSESDYSGFSILDLYEDNDSTLWIGTDQGLIHFNPVDKTLRYYFHNAENERSLSNNTINQVLRNPEGHLTIATNEGVNVFNEEQGDFTRYYYDPNAANSRAKSEIQSLIADNKGNLWIGSFGGGLIRSKAGTGKTVFFLNDPNDPESLSSDYINALYFDDAGILWIGTYGGGINKIDQVRIRFENINHIEGNKNSPAGDEVYAIFTDNSNLYFGTQKGLSICNRETGIYKHFSADPGNPVHLSGNTVYCIEKDGEGNIWVGTAGNGLNKLTPSAEIPGGYKIDYFKLSENNKEITGNEILSLHYSKDGTLWVGTSQGIFLIVNNEATSHFIHESKNPATLSNDEIYSLYEDREGKIWVGTYRGLNLFSPADSSFIHFDSIAVLAGSTIYSIIEDTSGNFWAGTDNAGLIRFNPKQPADWKIYTRADGLPDNVIYGILQDDDHNLWMSSNNGIFKVMRQKDSDKITVLPFNSTNGLQTDAFNIGAYFKGKDGIFYFGSYEGTTLFLPENVKGNDYIPPVYITGLELFFKPVKISEDGSTPLSSNITETRKIILDHNQNVLTFTFTALNYIEPQKNRFAFMMENLENSWNYPQGHREAQYLYLPPGEYRFRVRAANNDGLWNNEGASIEIIIKPPFTQTIWFYLLVVVGLILLVTWILGIRTRRLKEVRNMLEEQVQKRTHELRETNSNLQDEIKERLKVEEALKKSESRFRQLIETMNEGFSVQDKEGRITYVNTRLCQMFGYTPEEVLGHLPTDFIDKSDPENVNKFLVNRDLGMRTGNMPSYEIKWKHKNGRVFETMVSPKSIIDTDEGYTGSVAVITDISDLKNAEKELRSKNKALNSALTDLKKTQAQLIDSEKMASLGQLTAGVAHEINNPINFVSGNVHPLRRDIQDVLEILNQYDKIIAALNMEDKFSAISKLKKEIDFEFVLQEINHLLDGIGEGAQRTAEIVKGLRNFSRMDEHELKTANINQGIESTLLILHNKLKQNIEVVKEYGDIPEILCYPGQLNQVFMNVINNAVEAIQGEGKITIRTWMEAGFLNISVKDTGKKKKKKTKSRIFDPFFTTKEVGKGTGLGLSITFGIIEKHKGKIEVDSEQGEGTEFIISVPADLN